jgi:hypothetical protein
MTDSKDDAHEVVPEDLLRALLAISPEDAQQVRTDASKLANPTPQVISFDGIQDASHWLKVSSNPDESIQGTLKFDGQIAVGDYLVTQRTHFRVTSTTTRKGDVTAITAIPDWGLR